MPSPNPNFLAALPGISGILVTPFDRDYGNIGAGVLFGTQFLEAVHGADQFVRPRVVSGGKRIASHGSGLRTCPAPGAWPLTDRQAKELRQSLGEWGLIAGSRATAA